jgi:serine/threonine protein phosphatase PrpC
MMMFPDQLLGPPNEDRAAVKEGAAGGTSHLLGVFDGHGGAGAAEYVSTHILPTIERALQVSQNVYLLSRRGPVYRRMPAVLTPTATR